MYIHHDWAIDLAENVFQLQRVDAEGAPGGDPSGSFIDFVNSSPIG